jgi:predicted O-linked N-acetylglucosamine transferase (SPINDLY family)
VARDRAAAASDEQAAVTDRAAAATDRERSARDRGAAAQDRSGASGDREQAAVERAQHGYVPTSGGPSFRRVQAARARARETAQAAARATADLVERFIQAKQRELAAHLASVEVYEQLASLEEGLGHPERAAQARAKAERARELYRLAGVELAQYRARIKAVGDRRARRHRKGTGRAGG